MLQKIIVVLLGFAITIVGALAPDGLFAKAELDGEVGLQGGFTEQTLTTADDGGRAFTRVNALWIEVDGLRVTDDAWGTGTIKELRFKVGVKDIEGKRLVIGDKSIELEPTDVITVRMFSGDFAYRDVSTAGATLQLQGQVKTTLVNEGAGDLKVRTEIGGVATDATQASGADAAGSVAYVILDTGARLDTVAVEDGGERIFTEEAATAAQSKSEPGNLLAKWVKLEGKSVREYTWGDGSVGRIEFEPAQAAASSAVVAFEGQPTEVLAGQRVVVTDFVGEYTVFEVAGGFVRLRLDGYAKSYDVVRDSPSGTPTPLLNADGAPRASFTVSPPNPRSTDTIQFSSTSEDDDGIVVFTVWRFADEGASVLPDATHRFRKPGTYNVTLTVTDDDLLTDEITVPVEVRNADPVPDFDFSPKIVATGSLVTFTDRSFDSDGRIASYFWDFGEGNTSTDPNPQHRFMRPGNETVTLTVTDERAGSASLSKIIIVRNALPVPDFDWTHDEAPLDPMSQVQVRFFDRSVDPDGQVVDWRWNFGDGSNGFGKNTSHSFARPGTYTVTLTAIDDKGERASTSEQITVRNRPAIVDFFYDPVAPSANTPVTFRSNSTDPDGVILHQEWTFSDGTSTPGSTTSRSFPRAGSYWVNLTVIDSNAAESWVNKTVSIENTAPRARFGASPSPTTRLDPVNFVDLSVDPDGDALQSWRWDFGDGGSSTERNPSHLYTQLGKFTVRLNVTDAQNRSSEYAEPVVVLNARPVIDAFRIEPIASRPAIVNEPVYLNSSASDPDVRPGDGLEYRWTIQPGNVVLSGAHVTTTFANAGAYTATLVVRDVEQGESAQRAQTFMVEIAPPLAAFAYAPATPSTNEDVTFTDLSTTPNGQITSWSWDFGDGSTSNARHPVHRYAEHGQRTVRLTVTDAAGRFNTTPVGLYVNGVPTSLFAMDRAGTIPLGTSVAFTDLSTDPENAISTWTWDFGDGTIETYTASTDTSHAFSTPGTKSVRLTVTDEAGASHTSVQTVSVQNRAPRASFTFTPSAPRANEPITFRSTSSDPDGTQLASWRWSFGDGQTATGENVTHTFGTSGDYLVTLIVNDGEVDSPVTGEAFRLLRVGGADPLTARLQVKYPGDRHVDLLDQNVTATIELLDAQRQVLATVPKSSFVLNAPYADATFAAGLWQRGDVVRFTVQNASFMDAPAIHEATITSEFMTTLEHVMVLNLPILTTIEVTPGSDDLVPLFTDTSSAEGVPIYRHPFEDIHGNGTVRFHDGYVPSNTFVTVEMAYVPLSVLEGLVHGSSERQDSLDSLFGFCQVGNLRSDAFGRFAWTTDTMPCLQEELLFPPGLYQVRAYAYFVGAEAPYSEVASFIVDPTGAVVPLLEQLD